MTKRERQTLRKKRRQTVEPVFVVIKDAIVFAPFRLLGLSNAAK